MTENTLKNLITALTLPYPPSVNHYWLQSRTRNRRFISPKGVAFNEAVRAEAIRANCMNHVTGRLGIVIEFVPCDRRIRDYDNGLKALNDSLMKAGVFKDDSQIKQAQITMCEPDKSVKGGYCKVWLYSLE